MRYLFDLKFLAKGVIRERERKREREREREKEKEREIETKTKTEKETVAFEKGHFFFSWFQDQLWKSLLQL